ncbi:MAG: hypothetical protein PHH61_05650 [Candidatus Nanoarchaeia archaeon]|nr:hypothetical protein [Candidatus Nanoarchaeia archaeon]
MTDPFSKFKEYLKKVNGVYNSIDIRVACAKNKEGVWENVYSAITLIAGQPNIIKNLKYPQMDDFSILTEQRDISEIDVLLQEIQQGYLNVKNYNIIMKREEKQPYYFRFQEYTPEQATSLFKANVKCFVIHGQGVHIERLIDYDREKEMNDRMKISKYPYYGLMDVLNKLILHKERQDEGRLDFGTELFIIGCIPIVFDKNQTKILENRIDISVDFHKNVDFKKIALVIFENPQPKRLYGNKIGLQKKDLKKKGHFIKGSVSLKRNHVVDVKMILSYDDILIDEIKKIAPAQFSNKQQAIAHGIFDKNLEILRQYLIGDSKKKGADFELGVCWVMNMHGLITMYYGGNEQTTDWVDIVAFSSDYNYVYPIECTTGQINNKDKISKFISRYKRIDKTLKVKYPKIEILPIIATNQNSEDIFSTDIDLAEKERIVILNRETLLELLDSTMYFYDNKGLFEYLKQRIPFKIKIK